MIKKLVLLTAFLFQTALYAQSWEEFRIINEVDLGKTYGTLLKTENTDKIVLIIPGSGPTDRNGNSTIAGENNSLKYLAEGLAEEGISSLRIDKRGVNQSDIIDEWADKMTFEIFILDAINWISHLTKERKFKEVILLGHSQGSLVSFIATKASKDVKGVISIAGAASSADELILQQLKNQAPNLHMEAAELFRHLKNGESIPQTNPILSSIFNPKTNNFLASWIIFNPMDEILSIKAPILIIQGTSDLQVPLTEAEKLIQNARSSSNAQLKIIPKMNHVLKIVDSKEENLKSYKDPSFPVSTELLDEVNRWISNL